MSHKTLPPVAGRLLSQYSDLTGQRVDACSPQDSGMPLKDQAVHEHLLRSFRIVAKLSTGPLLDTLLYWRQEALKNFRGKSPTVSMKKLIIEMSFLEAVLEVLEGASEEINPKPANSLLKLAFEWVLKSHIYVPEPELERTRTAVTQLCARLLGAMTPLRLGLITDYFFKELRSRLGSDGGEAYMQERATLFRLCEAMKAIRLGFSTDEEVIMSTKFLEDIHPLRHVAKEKKSQVHHALCDMLTTILRRLGSSGQLQKFRGDDQVLQRWYKTVESLRSDIAKWALDQKKHFAVGYPFLAVLIALEPEATFGTQIKSIVDQVHTKLMRDSKTRVLTLHCLQECIQAYLDRYSQTSTKEQMYTWLNACLKGPMVFVKKGTLSLEQKPGQDIGASMLSICQIVANKAPEYALKELILGLLSSDMFSCQNIGLQALRNMILTAPNHYTFPLIEPFYMLLTPSQQVMEMMKRGVSPLDAYGVTHLADPLGEALARIFTSCGSLFGNLHLTNVQRSVLDHVPKEKLMGLVVLKASLLCLPYLAPSWTEERQAEMLAGYTKHAHQDVRHQATRALYRVLRCQPHMRPLVISAVCKEVTSISDDHPNVVEVGLKLLVDMAGEWIRSLQAGPCLRDKASPAKATFARSREVLTQLEGLGLLCLANSEPGIRLQALEVIRTAQILHETWVTSQLRSTPNAEIPSNVNYVADVIGQVGNDVARTCHWDFGRFSDLWRDWRKLPSDYAGGLMSLLSLSKVGYVEAGNDAARWARCLSELVRHMSELCPESVEHAYDEISLRCQRMLPWADSSQMVLRVGPVVESQQRQHLWRNYSAFACACPPTVPKKGPTSRAMMHLVINAIKASQELHFPGFMALGQCHQAQAEWLLDEIKKTVSTLEATASKSSKSKVSSGEVRVVLGHVVRIMAANTSHVQLVEQPGLMSRYLDFVLSTTDLCQRSNEFAYWDYQPLRYCCCSVVSSCADVMSSSGLLSLLQRKTLFNIFESWHKRAGELSREAQTSKDVMGGSRELQSVLGKVKDLETMKNVRRDMVEQCEALQTMASQARAALLTGPSLDGDTRLQGTVGNWIHLMFTSKKNPLGTAGPHRPQIAHRALRNLLRTNVELLPPVIDRCYLADASVSNLYFHVMAEVYSMEPALQAAAHILLSVVLYKMVDPTTAVRDDALALLGVMGGRLWGDISKKHVSAAVVGSLQDSYQEFQCKLSIQMAAEHPELSEQLCVEMLTRVLDMSNKVTRHQILICLPPWMQNLSFTGRENSWSNALLKSLYYVTWQHGTQFPYEVEKLWSTLAGNKRNIIPILDFLVCKGLEEGASGDIEPMTVYFSVAKRISLYLGRIASQQTVDHLVYEISQQLFEDDNSYLAVSSPQPYLFFSGQVGGVGNSSLEESGDTDSEPGSDYGRNLPGSAPQSGPKPRLSSTGGVSTMTGLSRASLSKLSQPAFGGFRGSQSSLGSVSRTVSGTDALNEFAMLDFAESCSTSSVHLMDTLARPLTRSELALCLLAEVAYEHDEDFRSHLPLLFHMALICMDANEMIVAQHASLLVVNLLYSISARHLEAGGGGLASMQAGTLEHVNKAIKQMQGMQGQRLWTHEDATLEHPHLDSFVTLQALTDSVLGAMIFESDLRERWGEEALSWAVEVSSRHLSGRSLQVYRSLKLPLSSHGPACLLFCLHLVLSRAHNKPEDVGALECAVDILLALQSLVDNTQGAKLVLYPQLFWACISALPLPQPQLFREVLGLLYRVLGKMDLNQVAVQNVVVASAPGGSSWDVDLTLNQSPPSSHHSSPAKVAGQGAAASGAPWGGIPSWKAGSHLLNRLGQDTCPWQTVAVQQLVFKGLFDSSCELPTVLVLMQLTAAIAADPLGVSGRGRHPRYFDSVSSIASITMSMRSDGPAAAYTAGIGVVLGPVDTQLLLSVVGLVPWIVANRGPGGHASLAVEAANFLRTAAQAQGHEELADALAELANCAPVDVDDAVDQLCPALARVFLPRQAYVFIRLLLCVLSLGPRMYHSTALSLLQGVLEVPHMSLGNAVAWLSHPNSFAPVAELIGQSGGAGASLAKQALDALDVVMQRFPGDPSQVGVRERWEVAGCSMASVSSLDSGNQDAPATAGDSQRSANVLMEATEGTHMLQPPQGLEMACVALEAVLGTCHKVHAKRAGKRGFMPFCNSPES